VPNDLPEQGVLISWFVAIDNFTIGQTNSTVENG
jgi:hypothetical protein